MKQIKRPLLSNKFIVTFDHLIESEISSQIISSSLDIKNKKALFFIELPIDCEKLLKEIKSLNTFNVVYSEYLKPERIIPMIGLQNCKILQCVLDFDYSVSTPANIVLEVDFEELFPASMLEVISK